MTGVASRVRGALGINLDLWPAGSQAAGPNKGRLVVLSGGMDSTALLYLLRDSGYECQAVSFNYGQRHRKELEFARDTCSDLDIPHDVVDLSFLGMHLRSALTDPDRPVPYGHYADETMRQTVVPNRNMIMLSMATGIAVDRKLGGVAIGIHAGDHAIYPDCRPTFIHYLESAIKAGNEGFCDPRFKVDAPFVYISKTNIALIGNLLEVPWEYTWSCYEGGDLHCGKCGTCVERIEAFQGAGIADPTPYSSR